MLFFLERLRQRTKLEAAWADTQFDPPETSVHEDLQRLEACLLSAPESSPPKAGIERAVG